MWRKAKDAEPQACFPLLCMLSNTSQLCHPDPHCPGGFFSFPPIFLHVHSPLPHHTRLLWFLSLFRNLGNICIAFGVQLRLSPLPPAPIHLSNLIHPWLNDTPQTPFLHASLTSLQSLMAFPKCRTQREPIFQDSAWVLFPSRNCAQTQQLKSTAFSSCTYTEGRCCVYFS